MKIFFGSVISAVILSVCLTLITNCTKNNTQGFESDPVEIKDTLTTIPAYETTGIDYVLVKSEMSLDNEVSYVDPQEVIDSENEDYVENSSFPNAISIVINESSPATVGSLPEGVTVENDGNDIIVTSTVSGVEFILSGSTSDGMFKVYSEKKFKLTLNGVSIKNTDGPAVNIQSSKRAFIVINEGTRNSLEDGSSYADAPDGEDQKGCLFSEGKLLFSSNAPEGSASGTLTITANYKHAVVCDDYVLLRKGNIIEILSAPKDGIHTNDAVTICGGTLKINTTGDAIECEEGNINISGGATTISTSGESSHGLKSYGPVGISGGALKITTSGDASKGISGDSDISITGGKIITVCTGGAIYDTEENDTSSPAGIKCDSSLVISNAEFISFASGNGGKGISADGDALFENAAISIMTTGKKYVYSSTIDSSPKGVKVEGNLTIAGGNIKIQTTGGEGSEALESKSTLKINDGIIEIAAYDDCINAAEAIEINDGTIYCYSSNNDGIDSNGTISISGGTVIVSGTQTPEEGIDCDQNRFSITGGTIIAFGGATSTPTASSCTQNSLIYSGSSAANTPISISGADGVNLVTCLVPREYQQMTLLFSSPLLTEGSSYIISTGGSVSNPSIFHTLYTSGKYSEGTVVANFTQSSRVTAYGYGGGAGGGNQGGGGWLR